MGSQRKKYFESHGWPLVPLSKTNTPAQLVQGHHTSSEQGRTVIPFLVRGSREMGSRSEGTSQKSITVGNSTYSPLCVRLLITFDCCTLNGGIQNWKNYLTNIECWLLTDCSSG